MTFTFYLFITTVLFGTELLYLQVAERFRIVDKPNERSSHTALTIRGGGILFWIAALGAFVYSQFAFPYFFLGLTLAAVVSFLDDLYTLPNRYRIGVQFVAVALLLRETNVWPIEPWVWVIVLVVGVGTLNAYNFMDGINGITAFYSLVTVGTLWFWQIQQPVLVADSLFAFVLASVLVFTYFNARRKAVCFAGDVGSVSIAVIILYMLNQFIIYYQTYLPILLLAVYGVDSVLTILHRLYLGQNIFQAHRLHLFQLLVHRLQWPHLRVSALYALLQLSINAMVLAAIDWSTTAQIGLVGSILLTLSVGYCLFKLRLMGTALVA
ncbi:putative undecaprenyl-phosphate N-acetylglucosaminyl 1-phosphate transferase [Fibrisoma limi BUZ 3]|uniref:Putative undecaprenyl-phosphate N-acetylglucosaminyl 1-phosphate transferase n=1 Tax=Fibrisoma limi BUZ 3 TaxID=1185876 RepID=I2GCJ6_9BACT|nr:undecaprenyl-phosphate N-acetylglucosaminyl 1-phosphate transferase [Fibrisoma limi]CCH51620.1 putative undecaprenyl-phosphate N-acetylglucosaminyl 1-phosphate transferase [Fibrisoma limi BUZ 3]